MVANHPSMAKYGPAERRAIEVHKYYLGIELGRCPALEEVTDSWERNYALQWRTNAMKKAADAQLREIEAHRKELIRFEGRTVDFEEAARDWVSRWGAEWRNHWEDAVHF